MGGAYTMVLHAALSFLKKKCQSFHFCYKAYLPSVLLMNIFKQTHYSDFCLNKLIRKTRGIYIIQRDCLLGIVMVMTFTSSVVGREFHPG